MKVNKKGALALGALIAGSMILLAGCASGTARRRRPKPASSGELTVWVDSERVDALKGAADVLHREDRRQGQPRRQGQQHDQG